MTPGRPQPEDPRMRGFRSRADVSEVLEYLEQRIAALPAEPCAVKHALGRVLAQSLTSPISVPSFDRSAMDGYAVVAEDTFGTTEYSPATLTVVGRSLPGRAFTGTVLRGQAVRIMTGAPLPAGADAVLEVERTRSTDDDSIAAVGPVTPGKHVGLVGEDVSRGTALFTAGHRLRAQDLGLLAATTIAEVNVYRRPTVTIIATGHELVPPGGTLKEHQIVDSNTPMLAALIARDDGVLSSSGIVDDDRDSIRHAIMQPADVVIVTGGSSVGEEDYAPEIVREIGKIAFHGIAMRPSSPTGIGFVDNRPVFLLPGNPVSALCAYEFFAGPTLRALSGRSRAWPHRRALLPLAKKITSTAGRVDYVRVAIDGTSDAPSVLPLMVSGASILSSTTRADGVVIVPRDDEGVPAGTLVEVFFYE